MYYIPQIPPSQSSVSLQSSRSSETGQGLKQLEGTSSLSPMRELLLFVAKIHLPTINKYKQHSTMSIAVTMRVGQSWRGGSISIKNQLKL